MKKYVVTGSFVTLIFGFLLLTLEQYRARAHCLQKAEGDDLYKILSPVSFKHGEQFGFDGDVNKKLAQYISPVEKDSAEETDTNAGIALDIEGMDNLTDDQIKSFAEICGIKKIDKKSRKVLVSEIEKIPDAEIIECAELCTIENPSALGRAQLIVLIVAAEKSDD